MSHTTYHPENGGGPTKGQSPLTDVLIREVSQINIGEGVTSKILMFCSFQTFHNDIKDTSTSLALDQFVGTMKHGIPPSVVGEVVLMHELWGDVSLAQPWTSFHTCLEKGQSLIRC